METTMVLDEIQDAILVYLDSLTMAEVEEHAIPDLESVPRDAAGKIKPYIAVQFGDLMPISGGEGFAGPLMDDYQLPVYIQTVASSSREARRLANFVTGIFLGQQFPFSGSVRKRVGGSQFPMEGTSSGIEAYISPVSFGLLVQAAVVS